MNIPGIPAKHAVITDQCRRNHGAFGAVDEAVARIKQEFLACIRHHPLGRDTKFHLVLTVEAAEKKEETNDQA
jgi:hypothetical protein